MPGFRAYLPDCRAYEMVSPAFKAGEPVFIRSVSLDGSRVNAVSLGSFAESSQGSFVVQPNVYQFVRTGGGWTTTALDPQASQFPASEYWAASADLASSVWELHTTSQSIYTSDLYRRAPDGTFSLMGPMFPRAVTENGPPGPVRKNQGQAVRGASADLSTVVFSIRAGEVNGTKSTWPFDATEQGHDSLYEYSGLNNLSPVLVGVEGGQGSSSLISECGTDLGSRGGSVSDVYNAVSTDGSIVAFTALHEEGCAGVQPPVDELYTRVNRSSTVAISEPSLTVPGRECSGACREDEETPAKRMGGVFQGASQDGSKIFFLTQQPLVNGDEEGTGAGQDLYEADLSGGEHPEVTRLVQISHDPAGGEAAEVQGVARVSQDGSHVYFVARGILSTEADSSLRPGHEVAVAGADNLYVYERDARFPAGHVGFVATLSESDESDWMRQDERPVQTTPEGRFVVFSSHARLTADDESSEEASQLFEYDSVTGELVRVSVGQDGYNNNGNIQNPSDKATIKSPRYTVSAGPSVANSTLSISHDGMQVAFESADSLAPQAVNSQSGCTNVYEYRSTETIRNGRVYLISDGQDLTSIQGERCGANSPFLGSGGQDLLFSSGDRLVPQAGDTQVDLYDARENGGFAAPVLSAPCAGEACQGALGGVPAFATAGSVTQTAGENVPPAARSAAPKPKRPKPKHKPRRKRKKMTRSAAAQKRRHVAGARS